MLSALSTESVVSIGTAVVTGVAALLGVVGFQNRRAKLAAIRTAFNDVVGGLASDDARRQLAAAILLRRFFDPASELGVRDLFFRRRAPYSHEALSVMTAVLRGLPSGDLQKVLSDGLAHAPTLASADLQRTNLNNTYLRPRHSEGTLEQADFYRADLSGGSLKQTRAAGAVFYQARLRGTVLRGADLRNANFYEADVTGANFEGALLQDASFDRTRGVPAELEPFLNAARVYSGEAPAPASSADRSAGTAVFLSLPSRRSASQAAVCGRVTALLERNALTIEQLPRSEYPPSDALGEIRRRISGCAGVVVFGLHPGESSVDAASPDVTPWTHLEAGMAFGCDLPLLIVREPGVDSGAFDPAVEGHRVHLVDLTDDWDDAEVERAMQPWLADLRLR